MISGVIHEFVWVMKKCVLFDKEIIMAARSKSLSGGDFIEPLPKKTRQGNGKHTKYAASSRNGAKKRYRGQGK